MPQAVKRELLDDSDTLIVTGLADEIAYRLRRDILDGKLPQGARLPHEELATRFGVSRTPIREALRQLQALNLVVVTPSRGATVRVLSRDELWEAYELRADMEGFACELACARASKADLDRLDELQAHLSEAIHGVGRLQEVELDTAVSTDNDLFHALILKAAGNRQLTKSIEHLQSLFPRNSVWRAIAHDPTALVTMNIDEHVVIASQLRARRVQAARNAMRDHVRGAGEVLLAHLDKQGFWQ